MPPLPGTISGHRHIYYKEVLALLSDPRDRSVSSNDWNNTNPPPDADGWVAPSKRRADERSPRRVDFAEPRPPDVDLAPPEHYPLQKTERPGQPRGTRAETAENGQAMAIFAHLSILFGLPIFLIPLLQRDNAFSLHHAKAAGAIYGLFLLCALVSMITCGLGVPLALLCYVPAIVGIVRAANLQEAGPWGLGDIGERIFSRLEVKEKSD